MLDCSQEASYQGVIKSVKAVYSHLRLTSKQIRLARWLADYYFFDTANYLQMMIPFHHEDIELPRHIILNSDYQLPGNATRMASYIEKIKSGTVSYTNQLPAEVLRRLLQRNIITVSDRKTVSAFQPTQRFEKLTSLQHAAYETCRDSNQQVLLQGVTGSGKTEIYLCLMENILQKGKGVIYLVPEINLTTELEKRLKCEFGQRVALIHSQITQREKFRQYKAIEQGQIDIVVGARSAVFAPLPNLGLIVVDEEQDSSYYQSESPVYHARDVAMVRGQLENAKVVLGSATPSLESYYNSHTGKYKFVELNQRYGGTLPTIHIIPNPETINEPLSPRLHNELERHLAQNHQAIIMLNRRGFSPYSVCTQCHNSQRCPHCDVALTYHKSMGKLLCHYCQYSRSYPGSCLHCKSSEIHLQGYGTQKVEEQLFDLFRNYGVLRMDRDTAGRRSKAEQIIDEFTSGKQRLLVGTQMIAKGHNFPEVELVGIIGIDYLLNMPDFRASERVYQLLMQVAGRAGRAKKNQAHVYIQTSYPELSAIECTAQGTQEKFYQQELQMRQMLGYPPFSRMAVVAISGSDRESVVQALDAIADCSAVDGVEQMGPAPFLVEMTRKRYQWKLVLKSKSRSKLKEALLLANNCVLSSSIQRKIFVDPVGIL
ncbi:primosomal protein N' (replication factor Y) [Desulfurispira natronophila]|uniref:Replication restart protein PriA n=1 Tax=Desulfurispira natronophila TaxID=682562 RepID=A0A7W8DG10_9BACT|nr:primosomal protein N' (replication factor Y) [Desulfurispira natronophila]